MSKLFCTSSSPEAVELYEKALFAYCASQGSPLPYLEEALKLDGGFVLAHCMMGSIWLGVLKSPTDPDVVRHVEAVRELGSEVTERERAHVKALLANASGDLPGALDVWANILVHHPTDAFAVRNYFISCIMLGEFVKMRDCLSSSIPFWSEDTELYPHILGFYAFSLEENNQRDRAEELARRALSINKRVTWAYHALSHVMEEERDPQAGVEFLTSSSEHWIEDGLGGHIAWHLSLYHLDLGNTEEVLKVFDETLCKHLVPYDHLALIDAASLLWRMSSVCGLDPGEERWKKVMDGFGYYNKGEIKTAFIDSHLLMVLARGKVTECTARLALAREMLKTMAEYSKRDTSWNCKISDMIGVPVCNALLAYGEEKYSEVVSLMLPLRYDFVRFGGSWAQRQVYSVTLIQAAVRSNQISLALALVSELKAIKPKNNWLTKTFDELLKLKKSQKPTTD